jgi:PRTRC genetic system protein E
MFKELMPLLMQRTLMITIARIDDKVIRANFIPSKGDGKTASNALTQPLTITGTPEELDRDLVSQLVAFSGSILETGSNLERIQKEHEAAIKAIEAENKKKLDEKRGKVKAGDATLAEKPAIEFKDGKPLFPGTKPLGTKAPSLFDAPSTEPNLATASGRKVENDNKGTHDHDNYDHDHDNNNNNVGRCDS